MKKDHIIQKVFVEIAVNNKEKAFSIKENINSFLSIEVFPKIEKYLNDVEDKLDHHTLQIPRLELNLDVKNSSLNSELKDKIAQLFKEELLEIAKPIEVSNQKTDSDSKAYLIDNQEKMIQTFIYFLEKGNMPWWNSDRKEIALLDPPVFNVLILNNNFQKRISSILSKTNVQERIINQLSNDQIVQLCLSILKNKELILKSKELKINLETDAVYLISKLNHTERQIIWRLVLNVVSQYLTSSNIDLREYLLQQIVKTESFSGGFSHEKKIPQNLKTLVKIFPFIKEDEIFEKIKNKVMNHQESAKTSIETIGQKHVIIDENLSKNDDEKHLNLNDDHQLSLNDGHYVQNAGLILIHPFIKTLFEHCDLINLKTKQLIDPELCAHLLHYIATGKTNAPEYEMVFEKFLCNIPMNHTINRHIKLSRKHQIQAKNVIESAQQNWNPMKKSSVELLRNEFFQRSGKLVATDHDYTLTVEQKTQDILLEKLAWGLGLVKLPWQEKFIFVNW
ncbi:MAG: hypothetical protein EOO19_04730 [Chryseobacterium sp.]|nr:MAG: hypothetical protein EOO19_04730 [Chryseobacterium sp.]